MNVQKSLLRLSFIIYLINQTEDSILLNIDSKQQ